MACLIGMNKENIGYSDKWKIVTMGMETAVQFTKEM